MQGTWSTAWSIHTYLPWVCLIIAAVLGPLLVEHYKNLLENTRRAYESSVEIVSQHELIMENYTVFLKEAQVNSLEAVGKEKWAERDEAFLDRIGILQRRIQKESQREVIERFGGGKHQVEFEVVLPTRPSQPYYFQVETAPLYMMPHSVHLFLEQVEAELWNGCTFTTNDEHVLLAEASSSRYDNDKLPGFEAVELDTVAFQEYADEFPHDELTLGFAGRPGGPSFYINKKENSALHGIPADSEVDFIEADPDPCFAYVVKGKDVVEMMSELSVNDQFLLKERVLIKRAVRLF